MIIHVESYSRISECSLKKCSGEELAHLKIARDRGGSGADPFRSAPIIPSGTKAAFKIIKRKLHHDFAFEIEKQQNCVPYRTDLTMAKNRNHEPRQQQRDLLCPQTACGAGVRPQEIIIKIYRPKVSKTSPNFYVAGNFKRREYL